MRLLPPVRFRFHEDDRERYGDDWCVYDEAAITRRPVRELMEIEQAIGMSITTMILRSRANFADANLAATWVSRRLAGVKEEYATYEPLVLLIDWETVPDAGDDADPPAQNSSTSPSEE